MSQLASDRIQSFEKAIRYSAAARTAKRLLSTLIQPDPLAVFCFCAVGLIVTLAALAAFADFSSAMEQIGGLY